MSVAAGTFLLFAAAQVGTPGPANMTLLSVGARYGARPALPFVGGVILGKQLIIWPIGFGLMQLADQVPMLFLVLKYLSAAYILWLAWKIANLRLSPDRDVRGAPGFLVGLLVHPLNPKAWAMIVAGFTNFVEPGTPPLNATFTIAALLLACQSVLHPIWTYSGDRIAAAVAGKTFEPYLMWTLAGITALSVLVVLI